MLAVFNWTKHPRSHAFQLADLDLSPGHQYQWIDVFQPEQHLSTRQGALAIEDQPAHSVRLIKIIDETIPASAPSVNASAPEKGLVGENLQFSSVASSDGVPAVAYRWDFDDGTGTQGAIVSHTYTRADTYNAHLQVKGVDGVAYQQSFSIVIQGTVKTPAPRRYVAGHP